MTLTLDYEWPETLPLPFLDYSGVPRNQTLFSPDAAYHVARRSRFTRSYCVLSAVWHFSDDQMEAFKAFLVVLGNGAAQFKIELRFPKNSALTEWAARFESSYEGEYNDGIWTVNAALELVSPFEF